MELTQNTIPATVRYEATGSFDVAAGYDLKIEGSETILEEEVPAGKAWAVTVHITVVETNA